MTNPDYTPAPYEVSCARHNPETGEWETKICKSPEETLEFFGGKTAFVADFKTGEIPALMNIPIIFKKGE